MKVEELPEVEWAKPLCNWFRPHDWSMWSVEAVWVGTYSSPLQFRTCSRCNKTTARSVVK